VTELERLGGAHAIPALRALLREEASDEVRAVAAIGLFRQGDPTGAEWLALHGGGIPLVRLSKRDLSAIFMDQGLRYLTLSRFERAEAEFKQVLELEPKNEIAWYNLACTYSRWGKLDLAFEHLQAAIECGFDDVSHMEKDPDLAPMRGDPRYRALIDGIQARRGGDE
jgi:tetratricopeptide (TPR) repeat protein